MLRPAPSARAPSVLVYRDQLLPYSETFILGQLSGLRRYHGIGVGTSRLPAAQLLDTQLSQSPVILGELMRPARVWKMAYKLAGMVPSPWMQALRQHDPVLLHAHFGGDGGFAIPLAKRLGIPLVVTFHGYDATWETPASGLRLSDVLWNRGQFFRTLLLQKRTATFTSAHRIVAVSRFIRDQLIQRGCPPEKITVHYTGIDVGQFTPDPTVAREPVVLFVGRLVEKKGCAHLIQAMAKVQRQHPQARLVVIGDGPLRSQLQALADEQLSHTQFLGVQPPAVVQHWMNRAYCLGGPSITAPSGDAEGLGTVFAEAQAMALPVVAFASGGIPEVVLDGKTGLLAPERDSPALAQQLIRLFDQSQLRQHYAEAGRRHILKTFDLHQNTARLEQLYDEVIAHYRDAPLPRPLG